MKANSSVASLYSQYQRKGINIVGPLFVLTGNIKRENIYKGMMFTAVCKDGNNSIFPMAWGIGDVENDSSWLWFFSKLKEVYGDFLGLVIVSYRYPSISKAIHQVYENFS